VDETACETAGDLPAPLAALYGGGLTLSRDLLYANLVASLDGVVSLAARRGASPTLSGRSEADRLVMGLLRHLADAVVIGAGTLRADRGHLWTASYIDRERALEAGALVVTTEAGAARLRGRLPPACAVRSLGAGRPAAAAILDAVRAEGHRRLLTEGGPTLLAHLVAGRALDELFLTLSPVLAGRRSGDGRRGLLEGVHLLPDGGRWARLRSLRSAGSHLFLRYALSRSGPE